MNGHGNSATTVKMYYWEPVKGYGGVTAFQDRDCLDDSAYFPAGAPGEKMFFRYHDLKYHNFSKNELDNFMIPVGYEATIFYNDGFSGRSETYRGMEKDGRMVCQGVDMANDTVSMTVMKQKMPGAYGNWIQAGFGQSKFTIKYGFTSSSTEQDTQSMQKTVTKQMETEIEHRGAGGTKSMSREMQTST
jgi:hypothetical protein